MNALNRSNALRGVALVGIFCIASLTAYAAAPTANVSSIRIIPAQTSWTPAPAQAPAKEGIAELPGGARLWYWDTGGPGVPVVLMHAGTGNGAAWEYQQPVFAKAGYRVIGYSRRGAYKSEPPTAANPGTGAGDLDELVTYLGIKRFHLVATAAGGFIALDYAVTHPQKLQSLVFANSLGGMMDADYQKMLGHLLPPAFNQLPEDFKELSPSYRASYRPGVDRWLHIHELNGTRMGPRQGSVSKVSWEAMDALRVPTLLLTGDSDLYMPPSSLRMFAQHIRGSEAAVFAEAAHSPYWEQPEAFNREVLRFLGKHSK